MHCCSLFVAGNGKWGEFEEGSLLHSFFAVVAGNDDIIQAAGGVDRYSRQRRPSPLFSSPSLVKSPLFCHDLGRTVSSLFSLSFPLSTRRMNFPSKLNEMITAAETS